MTNIKYIAFSFIIFLMLSNFAFSDNCNNPQLNCGAWSNPVFKTVAIDEYPDCLITFVYIYRNCIDNSLNPPQNVNEIKIIGFNDPIPISGCSDFLSNEWIPYCDQNGEMNWKFIENVFKEGSIAIAKKLFIEQFNSSPEEDKIYYYCPNLLTRYSMVWASCTQMAYYSPLTSPLPQPFPGTCPVFTFFSCDAAVCCRQILNICWNNEYQFIQIDETWQADWDECSAFGTPERPGAKWVSDCMPWCQ